MHLDEATRIVSRLKDAFPAMPLDEGQSEVLIREVALLHDPRMLDLSVTQIIQRDERFPSISRIRSTYRTNNELAALSRAALERSSEAAAKNDIPEWVHVWEWRREQTQLDRQAARESKLPVAERNPVQMRDFPQIVGHGKPSPTGVYSWEEYEQLEREWVKAGSPAVGGVAELTAGIGA